LAREAPGQEVGRPVHDLHRRDRRRRHAPLGTRQRRRRDDAAAALRGSRLLGADGRADVLAGPDPRVALVARADVREPRAGPTANDRKDIFDLYLAKVAHEADLDAAKRRDELARITNGYSPAMIEQVCSMALTFAHSDGRHEFGWPDIVEAMTTIESGTAQGI